MLETKKEEPETIFNKIKKSYFFYWCHFFEATCFLLFFMDAKSEHFFSCIKTTRALSKQKTQQLTKCCWMPQTTKSSIQQKLQKLQICWGNLPLQKYKTITVQLTSRTCRCEESKIGSKTPAKEKKIIIFIIFSEATKVIMTKVRVEPSLITTVLNKHSYNDQKKNLRGFGKVRTLRERL